ncbi:hypothetical protein [Nocardioides sp. AE5]|uniref:hypothetical protein n=1 Tax=Nocardioides sp. AE5 TaxID=2962573 RepID=UPI0028821779|nr:hypothetical protein [Nocardioides sp. AE5]MDT0203849.1 hypothetical protein [Nocardioides sp. AE5]
MKRSLAALAAASLFLLTACSGDVEAEKPSAEDAVQVLHDAVDATLGVDSMAIESQADLSVVGQEFGFGVSGQIDYEDLVGDVTMTTEQGAATAGAQILADGTTTWIRPEGSMAPLPEGKTWASTDVETLAADGSMEPAGLVGVVIALRGASEVEVGDSKEIDGEPARQYRTTIVYADAVEAAGDDREAFNSSMSLTGVDDADLVIEVWIGNDGVIRDFSLEIDSHGKPVGGTYDLAITKVGKKVNAPDAPPSDEVLDGPEGAAWIAQMMG